MIDNIDWTNYLCMDKAFASVFFNPLYPSIKLQIIFLCLYTFLTEVVGRKC